MPTAVQPSDPPRQFLTSGGSRIGYSDEGEGPSTIVAVPGLPGSGRDYRWLAPQLTARGARVIRIDPPGYGSATRGDFVGMSIADRAETVRTVISELDLPPVTLVGHSAGGAVVAHIAAHEPDLVHTAVMISATGPRAHLSRGPLQVFARLLRLPGGQQVWSPILKRLYALQGFPSYLTDRERALAMLDAAAFNFAEHRRNLEAMRVPTMVAWATDDPIISTSTFQALADMVPAGPRIEFTSGGHNVQKAQAVDLGAAIVEFAGG